MDPILRAFIPKTEYELLLVQAETILNLEQDLNRAKNLIKKYLDLLTMPSKRMEIDEVISETVRVLELEYPPELNQGGEHANRT